MRQHDPLTPAEAERIAMLGEECGEVVHAAMKPLRHGYDSYDPTAAVAESNRAMLAREISDLIMKIRWMAHKGDIPIGWLVEACNKPLTVPRYTYHQTEEA